MGLSVLVAVGVLLGWGVGVGVPVGDGVGEGLWVMIITVAGEAVVGSGVAERARQAAETSHSKTTGA